ncbi:hypothetical protein K493DRAFT_363925 [Basidiobolus meristosporus CBS 931.73]|uniref:Uncharacterized protein n=1 Tax=Basidiobolus meristosporus CBS 931.73 TaxID=1314790 RepID=A0A1Y1WQU4_9FUNG|nr:hypothetical protein K493DRAFT_363925 [Basidiobolus meristosporus CBS 931.73]|eukprot:ORX75909.1 hypothetical protein K493DRAFT_363925 [Basidiobolus meristosporus CBS 931.73]
MQLSITSYIASTQLTTIAPDKSSNYHNYMDVNEGKDEGEGEDSIDDTSTQPESSYNMTNCNIADMQPRQALLDRVNAHSSSDADALSNSNQFDQAQVIDQTLYQPKQQQPLDHYHPASHP